jgi:N-carbamoylputrescine amidase
MHIPDDPGYYEKYYFTPGDTGFQPVQTSLGKIGVLVCWDQWFPEAARLMALAGAECLVYPTAIGWDPADDENEQQRQLDSWVITQRAHAISNGLPLLAANRHGHESDPSGNTSGVDFWGNSFICGPQGEILSQGGVSEDCLLETEIDFDQCENVRQTWPFLRDRRIDAYSGLTQRFLEDIPADITNRERTTNGEKND